MNQIEQVMLQDLTNQVANLTADRAAWRARALVSEAALEEIAAAEGDAEDGPGDDEDTEVNE